MPFTPFHFAPALLAKAAAPSWFSWMAFVAATVVIDIESFVHLVLHEYPVHRQLHTLVGASLAGLATALTMLGARRVFRTAARRLDTTRLRSEFAPRAIVIGAFAGGVTHPILDGLMHADVRPFGPFSDAQPWLGAVDLQLLHVGCAASAIAAAIVLTVRARMCASGPAAARRP